MHSRAKRCQPAPGERKRMDIHSHNTDVSIPTTYIYIVHSCRSLHTPVCMYYAKDYFLRKCSSFPLAPSHGCGLASVFILASRTWPSHFTCLKWFTIGIINLLLLRFLRPFASPTISNIIGVCSVCSVLVGVGPLSRSLAIRTSWCSTLLFI